MYGKEASEVMAKILNFLTFFIAGFIKEAFKENMEDMKSYLIDIGSI